MHMYQGGGGGGGGKGLGRGGGGVIAPPNIEGGARPHGPNPPLGRHSLMSENEHI